MELSRLRAENKRLQMELEIAKKAATGSTGECNTHAGIWFICRRHETQCLSDSLIQLQGDLVQIALRVAGEAGAFGEVLLEQSVGILVRATLPRTLWITTVELAPNETSYARTAGIDGKGNAIVAWQQKADVADMVVFTSRYTVGGSWSSPAQIVQPVQTGPGAITGVSGEGIDNVGLNLSVTSSGNAVLVWRQTYKTHSALWASTYDPSNGWANANPVVLEVGSPPTPAVFAPAAGMDAKGNIMLVWGEVDIDGKGSHTTTMSQRYVAGSGWQAALPVTPSVDTTGHWL